jgi:uncharacterized protein
LMIPPALGSRYGPPFEQLTERARPRSDIAVLTPLTRGLFANQLQAAAFASATNQWLCDRGLADVDQGATLLGSIRVPVIDPPAAVREIERWADDARFVQIAVPLRAPAPYGDERYFPIWRIAAERGLAIYIHDDLSTTIEQPPTAVGFPRYFAEYHAFTPAIGIVHLSSLITSGTLDRLPGLRVVFGDGGIDLARALLRRLDKDWRSGRVEIPWLADPPSSYLSRLRFVIHAEDAAPNGFDVELRPLAEIEQLLLFGSHHPFWDGLDPEQHFSQWPAVARDRVLARNALGYYPRLSTHRVATAA